MSIKKIAATAILMIAVIVLMIGVSSFIGIYQLNRMNELNKSSYKVLIETQSIKEVIQKTNGSIFVHFSGNGWKSYTELSNGAASVFNMEDDQLKVDIQAPGILFWHIQLIQGTFMLEQDRSYILSFDAKSTSDREIQVTLEHSLYHYQHLNRIVPLTSEMKNYKVEFTMRRQSDPLVQLVVGLGKVNSDPVSYPHQVAMDNFSLIEADTGRELILNGQFEAIDNQEIYAAANSQLDESMRMLDQLLSDQPEQKRLLLGLTENNDKWLNETVKMIEDLSQKARAAGALQTDQDLQAFTGRIQCEIEIMKALEAIKEIEDIRLEEREQEARTIKNWVYAALGVVLALAALFSLSIYVYLNRMIIKPIVWTSDTLKDLADDGSSGKLDASIQRLSGDFAVTEIQQLYQYLISYSKLLNKQVQIDGLTGIANRRTFEAMLTEWMKTKSSFQLVLLDIDNFKQVNDTYGHLTGDEVIKSLASIMESRTRDEDLCFRFGGEEFGILVDSQDPAFAFQAAEDLRIAVERTPNPTGHPITVSVGISFRKKEDHNPKSIIDRADTALYQSKAKGKNQTTLLE